MVIYQSSAEQSIVQLCIITMFAPEAVYTDILFYMETYPITTMYMLLVEAVQPSMSEGKLVQPSVSEGKLAQPCVSEGSW